MSDSKEKEIVRKVYAHGFTVVPGKNPTEVADQVFADTLVSQGSVEAKNKQQLMGMIQFLWQAVPDLKWEVQEMLQDGNRVIVRSHATGTPAGDFMGMKGNGQKKFSMMTIDIHTVENGQVVKIFHVEDWITAMKQMNA